MKDKTTNTGGEILEGLNPEQKIAVTNQGGPLLIVAGAGSGKTHVITRRLAWLVIEQGVKPEEILALTFTNKAADEMVERVDKLLPYGYVDLWVSTFHTFCQRILDSHAIDIGLPGDVELLDSTGQWLLVREHFDKFDLDYYRPTNNPTKFIRTLLTHFSRLKDEEVTPAAYLEYAEGLKASSDDMEASGGKSKKRHSERSEESRQARTVRDSRDPSASPQDDGARVIEIANAYHTYQQLLLAHNKMDFGDLINYTLRLFRERPGVLAKHQKQFKHILVDEFQDTNWAQYDLVKLLAKPENNLTVVADDDQSIYRFRGASMSNVLTFAKDFPKAATVSLVRNYRSGQEILDASYAFIQLNNPNRLEASVIAREGTPDRGNSPRLSPRDRPNSAPGLVISSDGIQRDVRIASSATPPRNDKNASPFVINKKLIAQTADKASIIHLHAKSGHDEARVVVETILELKEKDKEATWNDFAVLVRANSQAQLFEDALSVSNIPHQNYSAQGLFRTTLVANILAFFALLDDYHESRAVFRLLNLPFLAIPAEDIIKTTHHASKKRIPLWSVVREPQRAGVSDEAALAEIGRLRMWVETYAERAKNEKPTQILLAWLQTEGYLEYLNKLSEEERLGQYRLLRHFWEHIKELEAALGDARVKGVLAAIRDEQESGSEGSLPFDSEAGPEMAKVMTIHSAKGLEFKYVFVTNLVDRRFPTVERREPVEIPDALVKEIVPEGDTHLEEERRLFYVACTRAKQGLFFTSAENYGGTQKKKLSRFLHELAGAHEPFKLSDTALAARADAFLPKVSRAPRESFKLPIPKRFSFTQLKIFDADPFEYKLQFIYKVPLAGKYVFSYGSTIHTTLQRFFQLMSQKSRSTQADLFGSVIAREGTPDRGNPNSASGVATEVSDHQRDVRIAEFTPSEAWGSADTPPRNDIGVTLDELLKIYEESWIDDWYESADQKEKYHKQGKSRLKDFYEHLLSVGAPQIKALERPFNLKVGDYTVVGRMDRVDASSDGTVRIVDYKTGSPKQKLSPDDKRQLLIYQLAAEEVFKEKVSELIYHYIDAENIKSGENQVSFVGTEKEKQEVKDWILDVIARIQTSDFAPAQDRRFVSEDVEYLRDLAEAGII